MTSPLIWLHSTHLWNPPNLWKESMPWFHFSLIKTLLAASVCVRNPHKVLVFSVLYRLMFYPRCTFQVGQEDNNKSLSEQKELTRGISNRKTICIICDNHPFISTTNLCFVFRTAPAALYDNYRWRDPQLCRRLSDWRRFLPIMEVWSSYINSCTLPWTTTWTG